MVSGLPSVRKELTRQGSVKIGPMRSVPANTGEWRGRPGSCGRSCGDCRVEPLWRRRIERPSAKKSSHTHPGQHMGWTSRCGSPGRGGVVACQEGRQRRFLGGEVADEYVG
jgi:hypothetical protein